MACLLQDVLNRRLLFKQTGNEMLETITHHFFVSGIGQKTVDAAKIVAAQKMLLKQKPSKHS